MEQSVETPECLSIIICDDVYRDEATKKMVLVGTFNAIGAVEFPAKHPRMHVLFTMTNGHGTFDMAIRVEHARTSQVLAELSGPCSFEAPDKISDFNIVLKGLEFPEAGKYWVGVWINETLIKQRPIVLVDLREQK